VFEADAARRLFLRFPGQRVVIAVVPQVEKAAHREQKLVSLLKRAPHLRR
jgi:hypothetical protein